MVGRARGRRLEAVRPTLRRLPPASSPSSSSMPRTHLKSGACDWDAAAVTRELSIQDVATIIERVPDLSGMMLVGGQALNYWAETLGIADARSTGIYGSATSEDIDILGSVKAVPAFAQAVGGKPHIAGFDDSHSPNSGIVTFDFEGETHSIDFL